MELGETIRQKLQAEEGTLLRLLKAVADDRQLIVELYITILNRPPTDRERDLAQNYLRDSATRTEGEEDLRWALLTSQEFLFNH